MSWYAINVVSRQEGFVLNALREAYLVGYAPMHVTEARFAKRKATRTKPLIPGYVFALLVDDYDVQTALSIRGVIAAKIRLRPIDVGALVLEEACHAYDETWKPPRPKGRRYNPRFPNGLAVKVRRGPVEGSSGVVLKAKGRDRFIVLMNLFGRDHELDVAGTDLEPAQDVVDARRAA
jgi:transcription antitermination factor NusG